MTPKTYLSQYAAAERRIQYLEERKEHWRRRAMRITPQYGPSSGHSSGPNDPISMAVEKVCEVEAEIIAEIDKAVDLRREVKAAIDAVPDPIQREVLERRYIGLQSLERIAVEMNYSYRQILRLHGWALQQVSIPAEKMAHHVT